jgi:hypothetical protein
MLHKHPGGRQIARLPEAFAKAVVGNLDAERFAVFGHLVAPFDERLWITSPEKLSTDHANQLNTSALRPADAF